MEYKVGDKVRFVRCVCAQCDPVESDNSQGGDVHYRIYSNIGKEFIITSLSKRNGTLYTHCYLEGNILQPYYYSLKCFEPAVLEDLIPDPFFVNK